MKARLVPLTFDAEGLARIDDAARILTQGGLVAFPTETVYGIACNADDPKALERLIAVKGRPEGKPFSVHIARREDLARHVTHVPLAARKLMDRYWPGPLTIVFPTPGGQGIGIRMPANRAAQELLRRTAATVVAPSANRSGQPPATSADEVAATLGDELDVILDGGPTRLGEASTVVRVTDAGWEMLREGSVTLAMLRRTLGRTIVFVCTANTCRSPMAEMLCKQALAGTLHCAIDDLPKLGHTILSAGTSAYEDSPASQGALEAMKRHGLDLSRHVSRPLSLGLVEDADLIFVMARHHSDSIRGILPDAADKIRMMDPSGADIEDPVGSPVETFLACAAQLAQCIGSVLDEL